VLSCSKLFSGQLTYFSASLFIVKISAKLRTNTYVTLKKILASVQISNNILNICYLSLFNSFHLKACNKTTCPMHHHEIFHYPIMYQENMKRSY